MARNKIKFNSAAFRAILVGSGTRSLVQGVTNGIASGVPGCRSSVITGGYGGGRVVGFVSTNARNIAVLTLQREALESAAHRG